MSTPSNRQLADTSSWDGSVITRVIKAWTAAYDLSLDQFARQLGMNPRTFYRHLKSHRYDAQEVQQFAAFMSKISGDHVTIADLYAGRISVFRAGGDTLGGGTTLKATSQLPAWYPRLIAGSGRKTAPQRGHLRRIAS